jgi:hypothetical protein
VAGLHLLEQRRNDVGRVLVVGMQLDDEVGPGRERGAKTGLDAAAESAIHRVPDDGNPETLGNGHCLIATRVVDEHHLIDDAWRNGGECGLQRRGAVPRRHDSHDARAPGRVLCHGNETIIIPPATFPESRGSSLPVA